MERYKNNTVGNSSIQYITINSKTETIQNYDTNNNKRNNSVRVIVENHLKDNNNNVQNVGSILN
jgi:ribosomal protein L33